MNMKQAYRLSTHYLAMFSALYCAAIGWVLGDPTHLKTVNDLTHGHAALLAIFNGAMLLYNLLHNPRTLKMVESLATSALEPEPPTPAMTNAGYSHVGPEVYGPGAWSPRKPPQPVQYAPAEALPQPPEPDQG
ncbi:MAG TPA: hypothetical protein VKU44_06825 [Terriglobia bacterium]|nr:hypothetical protein [Terriglobia bacterium]